MRYWSRRAARLSGCARTRPRAYSAGYTRTPPILWWLTTERPDRIGLGRAAPGDSESDGFAEQQHGAAPGVRLRVEHQKVVDGAGLPVGHLAAGAFQREGVVFDAAQRGAQVGYHLLRPDDPDRAGGAAG